MSDIIEFLFPRWNGNSPYSGRIKKKKSLSITQAQGPSGYEGYAHISNTTITVPHLDKFNLLSDTSSTKIPSIDIVLSGETKTYTDIPSYGTNTLTSLKQYFLEHPTREGIQYLIHSYTVNNILYFDAFIPGLIYGSNGTVMGYVPSYKIVSNEVIIKTPFHNIPSYQGVSGVSDIAPITNGLKITTDGSSSATVRLVKGEDDATITFYKNPDANSFITADVKTANEYGDYTVAAQLTDSKITSVLSMLSGLENKTINTFRIVNGSPEDYTFTQKFPVMFSSLLNCTPCENVKNVTPNFYKVPATFVGDILMTDVTGLSYNSIGDI